MNYSQFDISIAFDDNKDIKRGNDKVFFPAKSPKLIHIIESDFFHGGGGGGVEGRAGFK